MHTRFPRVKGQMVCDSPSTSDILWRKAVCEQLSTHHKCWYPEAVCTTEKGDWKFHLFANNMGGGCLARVIKSVEGLTSENDPGWALQWHQRQKNPAAITRLTVSRHILHPRLPKQSTNLWKSPIMIQRRAGEPGAFQPCAVREG